MGGRGRGRREGEAKGNEKRGREEEGKGFAGPMSKCFLRTCKIL